MKREIIQKLSNRNATIGIIGLGYIGLPLVHRFSSEGYKVIGIDISKEKVDSLNEGENYIQHLPEFVIKESIANGFIASIDYEMVKEMDVIIICVPTPLSPNKDPDLSFVKAALDSIAPFLRRGQAVSLESTTYPFTTRDVVLPKINELNLEVGRDIFLIYSPEREDPGNAKFSIREIPKLVSGISSDCLEVGIKIFGSIVDEVIPVSSTQTAEMAKLLENIHRAVNIGLVNEMKMLCDRMDIDIHEVIDAAASKPFGFTPYYPGPGLGGHCIPIDPFYLTWKAKEYGLNTKFIELAGEINENMPQWVFSKVINSMNDDRKPIAGSNILVLGVAYKKNVGDLRESPALEIIDLLLSKGAIVEFSDPFVENLSFIQNNNFLDKSVHLEPDVLSSKDLVIFTTDHDEFDKDMIRENSKKIIDTRGIYKGSFINVVKA
jgi:UDP-N-acetyl-D-glucosamine dehydrogenase